MELDDTRREKRAEPTRDRLSELPDRTLVHILSHLHTQEAARTSVLSKRFNSVWNSVHSLRFSDEYYSGLNIVAFVGKVRAALRFHRREFIDEFSLALNYRPCYKKFVDRWLEFAAQKHVKSVHLNFKHNKGPIILRYRLGKFLHENVNLVKLVTHCCNFPTQREINCRRLKFLSITKTKLNRDLISRILSGCSVLETLELTYCWGVDKFKINSSSSLKVLRIVGEQHSKDDIVEQGVDRVLNISGPNLVSLEVSGFLRRTKVRLNDLGSLVNAVMAFTVLPVHGRRNKSKSKWFTTRDEGITKEVLESLCRVEALTIGGSIVKVLSTCEEYNLSSPRSERCSLTLRFNVYEWNHLAIGSLLHSSPYLESLIIGQSYCSETCVVEHTKVSPVQSDIEKSYWKSWSTISKCPLLYLKTVKVVGFQVSCRPIKPLFQFLEFLLANSKVLEEIVIQASRYVTRAALNSAMKLLSVPTASPDVVVHFEPPHFWVDPLCMYKGVAPIHETDELHFSRLSIDSTASLYGTTL